MEMFKNFRLNRGKSVLMKKLARTKRVKFKGNINNAKTIGIVWDASNTSEFAILSAFYQKMHERNIDVRIIGFFPGKELPDKLTAVRYLTCLKTQDINFFYRPTSSEAKAFINTRFDILIDINFRHLFQLKYLSSLSLAGFKVGIFENGYEDSPFDLMIDINKNREIENYLTQVVVYLEMINTGTSTINK
jgi:hypothetical protein